MAERKWYAAELVDDIPGYGGGYTKGCPVFVRRASSHTWEVFNGDRNYKIVPLEESIIARTVRSRRDAKGIAVVVTGVALSKLENSAYLSEHYWN